MILHAPHVIYIGQQLKTVQDEIRRVKGLIRSVSEPRLVNNHIVLFSATHVSTKYALHTPELKHVRGALKHALQRELSMLETKEREIVLEIKGYIES